MNQFHVTSQWYKLVLLSVLPLFFLGSYVDTYDTLPSIMTRCNRTSREARKKTNGEALFSPRGISPKFLLFLTYRFGTNLRGKYLVKNRKRHEDRILYLTYLLMVQFQIFPRLVTPHPQNKFLRRKPLQKVHTNLRRRQNIEQNRNNDCS